MNGAVRDTMPHPNSRSQLLRRRLDAFARAVKALGRDEVRALHRARVASRRLRELVPILQLEPESARKLSRRLRKVTRRLGDMRELDVLLLSIDELHASRSGPGRALGRVGIVVSKERDRVRKRLAARLPASSLRRLMRKLERIVAALQVEEASATADETRRWRWAVDATVARRASRLATAMDDAGAVYLPDRLHSVRVALKKLRYAVELQQESSSTRDAATLRLLKRAQDLLGRMHDKEMLLDRVRKLQASLAPPTLAEWRDLDALVSMLEDDCRRLHGRYMRMREPLAAIGQTTGARPAGAPARVAARQAG